MYPVTVSVSDVTALFCHHCTVSTRLGLLDQLAQHHGLAADETVDGVRVDLGRSGDVGDRRPVTLCEEQCPSFVDDALTRRGRIQPTPTGVVRTPIGAMLHVASLSSENISYRNLGSCADDEPVSTRRGAGRA
jgi:hypothetical protein